MRKKKKEGKKKEKEELEYTHEIRIPKERVAVLIGKKGEIKKQIEDATKTKIKIDSQEGDVFISSKDALNVYNTRELITSIGRGFNPEIALLLLKVDYAFELINLNDYVKSKNDLKRIKGRVIGSEGKCRMLIEKLADCYICVYGKTIGIIGEVANISIARRAIENLLRGSPHGNVYKWLEKQRGEIKKRELIQDFE